MMSRFFPDPAGPVNEHPGPDFHHPPAPQAATHDLDATTENHPAANQDAAEARKADAQRQPGPATATPRPFAFQAPHQEAEASS